MTNASEETLLGSACGPDTIDFTWKSTDGLTLAGREWTQRRSAGGVQKEPIPVLCLPGLSRNCRDFNDIASFLQSKGHRVIAFDYRGRGKSDWDTDWRNYVLPVEAKDIEAGIEHLGLERFAVLGTSRGGFHALAMAPHYPASRMAAVIFNDIGPRIELDALRRIAATLGRQMTYASSNDLAKTLGQNLGAQFPSFRTEDWLKFAGQLATEKEGQYVMDYDPALARQLDSLDETAPLPELWHLYEKLIDRPVFVLRGEHSDLLTADTCRQMLAMHPGADFRTVPGQGHAPMLWDRETHDRIADFLMEI